MTPTQRRLGKWGDNKSGDAFAEAAKIARRQFCSWKIRLWRWGVTRRRKGTFNVGNLATRAFSRFSSPSAKRQRGRMCRKNPAGWHPDLCCKTCTPFFPPSSYFIHCTVRRWECLPPLSFIGRALPWTQQQSAKKGAIRHGQLAQQFTRDSNGQKEKGAKNAGRSPALNAAPLRRTLPDMTGRGDAKRWA